MTYKRISRLFLYGLALGLGLGLAIFWSNRALAQCGDTPADSSCKTCHDQSYPVYAVGEWHDIHASKDCCWNCHGGNTQAQDKDLAHAGMTLNPLQDTYTDCYACHPEDYASRADQFGTILGYQPVSSEPPARPSAPQSAPREDLKLVILPIQERTSSPIQVWPYLLSSGLLAFLAGLGLLFFSRRKSRTE